MYKNDDACYTYIKQNWYGYTNIQQHSDRVTLAYNKTVTGLHCIQQNCDRIILAYNKTVTGLHLHTTQLWQDYICIQ